MDGFPVREDASSGGRIPRFTASNGEVTVEFVFGGSPDEDPQDRLRARRPRPSRGLGLLRQEPQVHQDDVHRGLPQQEDEPHEHYRHEPALRGEDHGEPAHLLLEPDVRRGVRHGASGEVPAPRGHDGRPRVQRVRQEEERQRPPRLLPGVQEALRRTPTSQPSSNRNRLPGAWIGRIRAAAPAFPTSRRRQQWKESTRQSPCSAR